MTDFVSKTIEFNTLAGASGNFDARKTALYLGLVLEEVEETLAALPGGKFDGLRATLVELSMRFKAGEFDVESSRINLVEALDGFIDTAVVAIGGAQGLGADVLSAANHIADNNLSKFPLIGGKRQVLKDANGKVKKPSGYVSANVAPYLKG